MPVTTTIVRDSGIDLVFEGELLGEARSSGLERWETWRIYRIYPATATSRLRWVVDHVGESTVEGEVDLHRPTLCVTPVDVRHALRPNKRDGEWFMSDHAYEALERAIARDHDLSEAVIERV